jgi:hypothetical protein
MAANSIVQYEQFSGTPGDQMPSGQFLSVRRLSRTQTDNEQLWQTWAYINGTVQKLSAAGATLQPVLEKGLVQDTIDAINRIFGFVAVRVATRANRLFSNTFGGPNPFEFTPYSIRWPGENRYALQYIMKFVNAAFQVPQVQSNRLDSGILDNHATIILRPLFDLKAQIAKELFGYEIAGEISADELDAMFSDTKLRPPLHMSFSENRNTESDRAAKAEASEENESVERPTPEELRKFTSGLEVWTWVPTAADWATFAGTLKRLEVDGPHSEPVQPFPFTTGVIGSSSKAVTKTK